MSSYINFKLGKDSGIMLVNIAREHLLQNFDPKKAVETITSSLVGCPRETALEILIGSKILVVESDVFSCQNFDPEKDVYYEYLEAEEWVETKVSRMSEEAIEWLNVLDGIKREISRKGGRYTIHIDYKKLLSSINGDLESLLDIDDEEELVGIKNCVCGIKDFIEKCYKIMYVADWLFFTYPKEFLYEKRRIPDEVITLHTELTTLLSGNTYEIDRLIRASGVNNKIVDNYIQSQLEADGIIKEGIKPVDILDGYDAGWLSPNGEYYGLNGTIANMLHSQIADALLVQGIIPIGKHEGNKYSDNRENPDRWLEENGWVKIHGDWILYDGWNRSDIPGSKVIPMTEIQQDLISKYGQVCCKGVLSVGFNKEKITAKRFEMTEAPMLKKYFDF